MSRRALARTLALAAVVVGCAVAVASPASAAPSDSIYRGTATVTVGVNDYCDFSRSGPTRRGVATFTMPMSLTVGGPRTNGAGESEANPVHLEFGSQDQAREGAFLVSSAQSYATSSGSLGLRYWSLDQDGGEITGTLTDDHRAEGAALNSLWMNAPLIPCQPSMGGSVPQYAAMAAGSRLAGTLGSAGGAMVVAGSSSDGLYDFRIDMTLMAG